MISPYFGGISLYFCLFLRKSPYENFLNILYILFISLFGISDLPTKIQEFPSLFNHSPYLEKKTSLFVFWDVSHVCLLERVKTVDFSETIAGSDLKVFFFFFFFFLLFSPLFQVMIYNDTQLQYIFMISSLILSFILLKAFITYYKSISIILLYYIYV